MSITTVQNDILNKVYQLQDANKSAISNKTEKTAGNSITDDYSRSDEMEKWSQIAQKYDVTNISENEICKMGKELYDSGLISLKEMAILTISKTRLLRDIQEMTGKTGGSISGYTNTDPDKKLNYIDVFKKMEDYREKYDPNAPGIELNRNIISMLEKMNYLAKSS